MSQILLGLILILGVSGCAALGPEGGYEKRYQATADETRVHDIVSLAKMMQEYHARKGHYPLADGQYALPVYVGITKKKEYLKPEYVPLSVLADEIKSVLGEHIELPMDPQKYDVYGPRFYLYSATESDFFISARLFSEMPPYTRKVGEYDYVYVVSSKAIKK